MFQAVAAGREHNLDSILTMVTGFGMCFFGGAFTTTIATVEAFNQTGWTSVKNCALDIRADLIKVCGWVYGALNIYLSIYLYLSISISIYNLLIYVYLRLYLSLKLFVCIFKVVCVCVCV